MRRTFVVVDEQDEYGEIILSLAALEVCASIGAGQGRASSSNSRGVHC